MKTRLLCALCAFFPLSLLAAKVHKITPITTDKDIRIEVMLSAEANESLSLDAVIRRYCAAIPENFILRIKWIQRWSGK